MNTRSVTIEDIDELFLEWNDHINASALFRSALSDEMNVRDIDRDNFRELLERARDQGYTFNEIIDETDRLADLESVVESDNTHAAADTIPDE